MVCRAAFAATPCLPQAILHSASTTSGKRTTRQVGPWLYIGRFHTDPKEHALTKVAGELTLSLDVRAYDKAHLRELEGAVIDLARDIGRRRGVRFELSSRTSADVTPSHPEVVEKLTTAAEALGITTLPLASPASHDTATFTVAGVPSAMVFVRNANGSHNPREAMAIDDFLQGAAVLTGWLVAEAVS